MVDTGFEELNLDENELVIKAFEFSEKTVDECEGFVVGLLGHVEGDEASFEVLPQERAAFGDGPLYT